MKTRALVLALATLSPLATSAAPPAAPAAPAAPAPAAKAAAAPAAAAPAAAPAAKAAPQVFEVDRAHTVIGFKASTLLFDVPGRFNQYKVQISGDPETGKDAKVRLEIESRSIDTNNQARDKHLRSDDFFDVVKFPKIVFTSESVTRQGDKVVVQGTLDLHGVKKPVTLPFSVVAVDKDQALAVGSGGAVLRLSLRR